MNVNLLVKLNFLVLGILLCGYIMYCLNNDGLPQSVNHILGIPTKDKSFLTWCDTRAKKLIINDSITLYQKNNDWFAQLGQQEKKLNTIALEKWFSNYCRLTVHFTKERPKGSIYSNRLGIQFISGAQATFKKGQGLNIFKWKQRYFESNQLDQALKELNRIVR